MGLAYLWDTNIVIYYLQQQFPPKVEVLVDDLLRSGRPVISAITEIELRCWKGASDNDTDLLTRFISECTVIELEQEIKLKTAELRKTYKIKLPDAVIAATALVYDLILISRNVTDFRQIRDLQLKDLYSI